MSVKIRFTRVGRPHAPYFRLVAAESTRARDAKPIEVLGSFNPKKGKQPDSVKVNRIRYWLSVGAKPSNSALQTLKKLGLWEQIKPGSTSNT